MDEATNIHKNTSILSWSPPFSLDLTNIEPDIVYCVEVYNITCGERDLIISDCDVTEPSYTSSAPDGYIYEYIIIPRSNVEWARNLTPSQPLRGMSDLLKTFSVFSIIIILEDTCFTIRFRKYSVALLWEGEIIVIFKSRNAPSK